MAKSGASRMSLKDELVMNKIHYLRKQKIILDRDLAVLYNVKPTRLREQVKRNLSRFPSHFMFRLNKTKVKKMVSQNGVPSVQYLGGSLPLAFTEHAL